MNEKDKKNKYLAVESGSREELKYQEQNNSSLKLKDITEVSQTEFSEKKIDYTLEKNGSNIEKKTWKLFIKKDFPNYEDFWIKFVVPRTNRPKDIGMKDGLELIEQKLISFHYSIIHNIFYVKTKLRKWKKFNREMFEICYVRLSAAIDSCVSFLFLYLIWDNGKNKTQNQINQLLDRICTDYISINDLKKSINKLDQNKTKIISDLNKEKNYNLRIISKEKIIKYLTKEKKLGINWKDFFDFIESIRCYRNIIVHSWPIMDINNRFPKRKMVSSLKNWLDIDRKLRNDDKNILNQFDDMRNIITKDLEDFLRQINDIWKKIII